MSRNYFFYNTDADAIKEQPKPRFDRLIKMGFAAAGGQRKYGEKFGKLAEGDCLLMYENGVGVVAVGKVKERWDGKPCPKPLYYTKMEMQTFKTGKGPEYRIKVKWFPLPSPVTWAELQKRFGIDRKGSDRRGGNPRGGVQYIDDPKRQDAVAKLIDELGLAQALGDKANAARIRDEFSQQMRQVEANLEDEGYFDPQDTGDERKRELREIVQRRGAPEFRKKLISAYKGRCVVTDCDAVHALEAAHITPYSGEKSDHLANGLLLRADIHTLFDLNLIGIDPESLRVVISRELQGSCYEELDGRKLNATIARCKEALRQRWEECRGR